ncbi:hypothetical protein F7725_027359 [Dissostichus mawsoni]|uniref:HAT C-terminal dimerisation domain-containing protein n=1 Tax=Dissostichus mawsoni TaxID=36200 RepID=A0A7J5XCY0_DISMA|nr:hypothetical protein F7725_027359 [Dissostichus mawsoni]
MAFLEEATLMDPRFKGKLSTDDERRMQCQWGSEVEEDEEEEVENCHVVKKPRVSALRNSSLKRIKSCGGALFNRKKTAPTILENIRNELSVYRGLLPIPTSEDPAHWWWRKETFPILSRLSTTYLCVQASSTPSERRFYSWQHSQ